MKSPSVVPFKFQHNGKEKGSLHPSAFPAPTGLGSDLSSVVLQASEWSTKGLRTTHLVSRSQVALGKLLKCGCQRSLG